MPRQLTIRAHAHPLLRLARRADACDLKQRTGTLPLFQGVSLERLRSCVAA